MEEQFRQEMRQIIRDEVREELRQYIRGMVLSQVEEEICEQIRWAVQDAIAGVDIEEKSRQARQEFEEHIKNKPRTELWDELKDYFGNGMPLK